MWVTAQEGDADHYGYNGCTPETNPWPIVMESIAKYDPYDHPSTCHMENSYATAYDKFFSTSRIPSTSTNEVNSPSLSTGWRVCTRMRVSKWPI
jgi:hypothetical protein